MSVVEQSADLTPCPGCGTLLELRYSPNYLELQAKLYGTTAVPKYNEGLGAWTTGKSDRREKARQRKLIPADE